MPKDFNTIPAPTIAELPSDLADRLARYRARVQSEGRKSAVEKLDRAIDQARRDGKR